MAKEEEALSSSLRLSWWSIAGIALLVFVAAAAASILVDWLFSLALGEPFRPFSSWVFAPGITTIVIYYLVRSRKKSS